MATGVFTGLTAAGVAAYKLNVKTPCPRWGKVAAGVTMGCIWVSTLINIHFL